METKKIKLLYFAGVRQKVGKNSEDIETKCNNVQEIYAELNDRYKLNFADGYLKFALNEEYVTTNTAIKNGDILVLIPPVAGG